MCLGVPSPEGLKPIDSAGFSGTTKVMPFQNSNVIRGILDSQLQSACRADAMGGPFGLPDQIHFNLAYLLDAGDPIMHLFENEAACGALWGGQGHGYFDLLAG